jgi:hypothetical protein
MISINTILKPIKNMKVHINIIIAIWLLVYSEFAGGQCLEISHLLDYMSNVSGLVVIPENRQSNISSANCIITNSVIQKDSAKSVKRIDTFNIQYDYLSRISSIIGHSYPYSSALNIFSYHTGAVNNSCQKMILKKWVNPNYLEQTCLYDTEFNFSRSRDGKIIHTKKWDPSRYGDTLIMSYSRSYRSDRSDKTIKVQKSALDLQLLMFHYMITSLPMDFFLEEIYQVLDTNQFHTSGDSIGDNINNSVLHYSCPYSQKRWNRYFKITFNAPYYYITEYDHKYMLGKKDYPISIATLHFDGRPINYKWIYSKDGRVLGEKTFKYDAYGNLLSSQWITNHMIMNWEFKYSYFPDAF